MKNSSWRYFIRFEEVSVSDVERWKAVFDEVDVFDPAAAIERAANAERKAELSSRWSGYSGVRVIAVANEANASRISEFLTTSRVRWSTGDLLISFKAETDSELHCLPLWVINIVRSSDLGITINYTLFA